MKRYNTKQENSGAKKFVIVLLALGAITWVISMDGRFPNMFGVPWQYYAAGIAVLLIGNAIAIIGGKLLGKKYSKNGAYRFIADIMRPFPQPLKLTGEILLNMVVAALVAAVIAAVVTDWLTDHIILLLVTIIVVILTILVVFSVISLEVAAITLAVITIALSSLYLMVADQSTSRLKAILIDWVGWSICLAELMHVYSPIPPFWQDLVFGVLFGFAGMQVNRVIIEWLREKLGQQ